MSSFEIYVFVLCALVFCLLGGLSSVAIVLMYRSSAKLIALGGEDEAITTEYHKKANAKGAKAWAIVDRVVSILILLVMCVAFAFSLYMHMTEDKNPNGIPSLKVVKSPSMSYIHEKNQELADLGINDQIQTYDLIVAHHLPAEHELELYDIVLYESNGMTVIHRIVDIEEPNANHPDCRYFVLQGDANEYPDRIPVYYTQMKGIYRGERIPFVGSFILFMQSPAGWMCIILILIASVASPILEKRLSEKKRSRLIVLGVIPSGDAEEAEGGSHRLPRNGKGKKFFRLPRGVRRRGGYRRRREMQKEDALSDQSAEKRIALPVMAEVKETSVVSADACTESASEETAVDACIDAPVASVDACPEGATEAADVSESDAPTADVCENDVPTPPTDEEDE